MFVWLFRVYLILTAGTSLQVSAIVSNLSSECSLFLCILFEHLKQRFILSFLCIRFYYLAQFHVENRSCIPELLSIQVVSVRLNEPIQSILLFLRNFSSHVLHVDGVS